MNRLMSIIVPSALVVVLFSASAADAVPVGNGTFLAGQKSGFTVSAVDLINGLAPSSDSYDPTFEGGPIANLNDGTTGMGADAASGPSNAIFDRDDPFFVEYTLSLADAPYGYTLTGVDSYTGHQDNRTNQTIDILVKQVGGVDFESISNLAGFDYSLNQGDGAARLSITDPDDGVLASNVEVIRFQNLRSDPTTGSGSVFRELDIFGAASTTPIPVDITMPSDPTFLVNGMNDGDGSSGSPPAAEGVENAIDDTPDKYLNFLDLGSGLIVTPQFGPSLVTGLRLFTANDAEERDPASFILEGSNNGESGPFFEIASGPLMLPSERNTDMTGLVFFEEVQFMNNAVYSTYRLTFPTLKDAGAANSMQIGEVEILGLAPPPIPEPGTATLALLTLGGLVRRRRRA